MSCPQCIIAAAEHEVSAVVVCCVSAAIKGGQKATLSSGAYLSQDMPFRR